MTTLGVRLGELIKKKGFTQRELAKEVGVTEAAMSLYVKGARIPRASILENIAKKLDTTSDYLLNGTKTNRLEDLIQVNKLLARNVSEMTPEEKMQIISILISNE